MKNADDEKFDSYVPLGENTFLCIEEPVTEYKQPLEYRGTTINGAIKDYYSYSTNREKVAVLKWIVNDPEFQKLKRFSNEENAVYGLNISQYDDILLSGEMPKNLQIAHKFVKNHYDVFLLSNPSDTKSADFVIRRNGLLYYVEGKTSSGGGALLTRLADGAKQSSHIAVNFLHYPSIRVLISNIQEVFHNNCELQKMFLFKGSRLISVQRDEVSGKNFERNFYRLWKKRQ